MMILKREDLPNRIMKKLNSLASFRQYRLGILTKE